MRDRLISLVEKADLAIASCSGVVSVEDLHPLIESVKAVRTRMAYPEDVLVIALAGGTGSGKSSLLNAIAGEEIAEAGGIRPTTSRPMAAMPADRERALAPLLETIGISEWAT
ncbi:MAG TPA: dynamin family protein, partial [Acidimicrobiia bacterium]